MENYRNHKHYEIARRAHYSTSFSPDKRAEMRCKEFDADIASLKEKGASEQAQAKYEKLWLNWMNAKSRCLSSMITGPANFPVARAEKANRSEENHGRACIDYFNKVIKAIEKEAYYEANPHARPIMSGDSDALERLKSKLEACKKAQETMKAANKIVRKKPIDKSALMELLGTIERVEKLLKPNYMGAIGFEGFELSNNNAEIKRLEGRIKQLETRKGQDNKEIEVNGVKVIQNSEDMRLQIFFEGKPDEGTRKMLKSNAFKWAPSKGAWQRQLTNNAIYAFENFVRPALEKLG